MDGFYLKEVILFVNLFNVNFYILSCRIGACVAYILYSFISFCIYVHMKIIHWWHFNLCHIGHTHLWKFLKEGTSIIHQDLCSIFSLCSWFRIPREIQQCHHRGEGYGRQWQPPNVRQGWGQSVHPREHGAASDSPGGRQRPWHRGQCQTVLHNH